MVATATLSAISCMSNVGVSKGTTISASQAYSSASTCMAAVAHVTEILHASCSSLPCCCPVAWLTDTAPFEIELRKAESVVLHIFPAGSCLCQSMSASGFLCHGAMMQHQPICVAVIAWLLSKQFPYPVTQWKIGLNICEADKLGKR